MRPFRSLFLLAALIGVGFDASAHNGSHASVHDTVATIMERLKREKTAGDLVELTVAQAEGFLTAEEREVLSTEHLRFRVNVPVIVTVVRDATLGKEPFWLPERGFNSTGSNVTLHGRQFDLWEKPFSAGSIGLGVTSLSGKGTHYLVLLKPQTPGTEVKVTSFYPAHLRTTQFVAGVEPFVGQSLQLKTVPPNLQNQLLIRVDPDRNDDARLVSIFSQTRFPAKDKPDQLTLTWSEDPRRTQTIQWRTSTNLQKTFVRYQPRDRTTTPHSERFVRKQARTEKLPTPNLVNDPLVLRHTAVLKGLKPGTTYLYSVGDGSPEGWTEPAEFTTAPGEAAPFSFVYMGDAQNGLDRWGTLLGNAHRARPDAAFYLMAGDLVNRGAERWDWDSFFEYSKGVFDRRPIVPVIGNHECQGGSPELYLTHFTLPRNGPRGVTPERAYAFEYSNAKFIILDSNVDPAQQTAWLEKQLANTKATWKFVSYHHPAYSSGGNRDNERVRNLWTPIFDRYHVDLALQGHDHAYLRTYPMRGQKRVATTKDGTVYLISVSGTKFYDQPPRDYIEVGFTKVATYQVLDIEILGNRLRYRAQDIEGNVRDEFVIEK